jgi:hypothetical protein
MTPSDPLALLRSRSYAALLVLAVIIGAPVSAAAYFFLALVSKMQGWIFTDLPKDVGLHSEPLWWPITPARRPAPGRVPRSARWLEDSRAAAVDLHL